MLNAYTESPLPQTIHKNQLQVDGPSYERQNYKNSTREYKEYLYDLGVNKEFLNRTKNSIPIKDKTRRFNYIRNLCSLKGIIMRVKRHATKWEEILISVIQSPDKRLILKYS